MKKLYNVFFIFVLIFISSNQSALAQTGPAWAWAVNNNAPSLEGAGLVTDAVGNVYTAGYKLSKHSPSGALLWSRVLIDSSQDVNVRGLTRDSAGDLYLAGYFAGTIQLDTITLNGFGHTDIFVAKFNSNGDVQWARWAGSPGPPPLPMPPIITEAAYGIAVDSTGNCYITGMCSPGANFGPVTASSTTNSFVAKYDTQGNVQWVRAVPHEAYGIAVNQQSGYFLTGRFDNSISNSIYCEKYNANGTLAWSKQSITKSFNYAKSVATDLLGNCFITGSTNDTVAFDHVTFMPSASGYCMFLVKYDAAGNVQWGRQTTGNNCYGEQVVTDGHGNIYVTGGMYGNVGFSGAVQVTGTNSFRPDIFAAKYNTNGNLAWALQAGSFGNDYGQAIGVVPNGEVYVAGSHQSTCTFGNVNLSGSHAYNFFVAKISANPLSVAEKFSGTNFTIYPNPAASEIKISAENFRQGTLTVFNLTGQEMYESAVQPEMNFQVENWPAGIYAVKLTSGNKTVTQKLIVTH